MRFIVLFAMLFIILETNAQTSFNVNFNVVDANGKKITGADIRILNHLNGVQSTTVGVYTVASMRSGVYSFSVTAEGYATVTDTLHVSGDRNVSVTLNSDYKKLDDVVVYAEKQERKSYQSPSSVTTINAKQLREMRIWSISDLSGVAPNLTLSNSGDNRNVTGIRGIVTTSYEQAVATYVDGVAQFGLDTYLPQLNDVESIDIIRGAQGNVYGRNAMGGVIHITTKKPTNKTSLFSELSVGNYGQKRITAAVKTPLIKNKLFVGLNFLHDARNGFYTNDFTKSRFDDQQQTMIGGQLRYLFADGWSLQADFKRYKATNQGAFPLNSYSSQNPDAFFSNGFVLQQNLVSKMNDNTGNTSFVIQHRGEKTNLTIQSSRQTNYRYYDNSLDADFSPADIVGIFNNYGKDYNRVNVLTNEIRLQSMNTVGSKLNWTLGAYHFIQDNPTKQATVFGKDAGLFGAPDTDFSIISTNIGRNDGYAGFGNLTYAFSNKWEINGGVRIDKEYRRLTVGSAYEKQPYDPFPLAADTTGKSSFAAFSPKIGVHFKNDENHITYLNISRGFRAGGLSGISSDPSQLPLSPYLPEYSTMIEAGTKGENENKTFRYAFTFFYNLVRNIQTPVLLLPDAVTITKNAGKLNASGLEVELMAKPVSGLTLQYVGGFTQAEYAEFGSVSNGETVDFSGNKQIFTPSSAHFITSQYNVPLGKNELQFRLEYKYTGTQFFDFANNIRQDGYGLMNTRIALRLPHIEVSFWGRNLLNKKYIDYAYDFGAAHLGNPRMIGLSVGYRL